MSKRKRRTGRAESCPWRVLPSGVTPVLVLVGGSGKGVPLSWSSLGVLLSWFYMGGGVPLSWSWPGGGGTSILGPDLSTPPPTCPQLGPGQRYPQKGPGTRGWEGTWDQTLGYPQKGHGTRDGVPPPRGLTNKLKILPCPNLRMRAVK